MFGWLWGICKNQKDCARRTGRSQGKKNSRKLKRQPGHVLTECLLQLQHFAFSHDIDRTVFCLFVSVWFCFLGDGGKVHYN